MKGIKFEESSKYKTDNKYYELSIANVVVLKMERSWWRWLIQIIDDKIN